MKFAIKMSLNFVKGQDLTQYIPHFEISLLSNAEDYVLSPLIVTTSWGLSLWLRPEASHCATVRVGCDVFHSDVKCSARRMLSDVWHQTSFSITTITATTMSLKRTTLKKNNFLSNLKVACCVCVVWADL